MRTVVKKGRKLKITAWFASAGFFLALLFVMYVTLPFECIACYIRSRFKK